MLPFAGLGGHCRIHVGDRCFVAFELASFVVVVGLRCTSCCREAVFLWSVVGGVSSHFVVR